MAVVDKRLELVMFHDGGRNVLDGDAHVFVTRHRSVEVEVLDVDRHELGVLGGENAVGMHFDGGKISGGCVGFAVIFNAVAADSEADSTLFGFVGFERCNDAEIGGTAIAGHVGVLDEVDGLGTTEHMGWNAIG